jgi:protein O-GlcNAc transferase
MNIDKATQSAFKYYQEGNLQQAKQICEKILIKEPNNFNALHLLGIIYYGTGNYDFSIKYIRKAIQNNPNIADAYFNLGASLKKQGQYEEAITCYQKALQLNPNFPEANCNLGVIFQEQGYYDEARTCFGKALQVNPMFVDVLVNLGTILKEQGKVNEAENYYRCALQIKPDFPTCYSNILFIMNFNSGYETKTIFSEHLRFAKQYEQPLLASIKSHANERIYARQLKIGYVSPDFRRHSVAYFIEPILSTHNRESFKVYCYSDVTTPDEVTERMYRYSDQWRDIGYMSDGNVNELIRKDGIDILVDLAGHTAHNRMLLFVHKPAPVQVSWLGYPATTGLSTIDYKIVDSYTDPPGMTDQFYTERLIRLPESFLCYLPDKESPEIGPLPALSKGHITFGSFNDFAKVSPEVFSLWLAILKAAPNSFMIIKAKGLSDKKTCQSIMDVFIRNGITSEKIELLPLKPSPKEHLNLYNRIDIGLDTFPYNGTTTTCEALWMGVPVITLEGNTYASRVGVSLLSNIGLQELIAKTYDQYIEIAVKLANDIKKLKALREELRGMMERSPLTDAKRFSLNLEECYRKMWENFCRAQI